MEYENIPKYENLYEVNRNGDINRILKSGARKPLKPRRDVNNQKFVTLCKKGEKKYTVSVRRVVFLTFADVDHSKKWDVYLKNKNKNDCSFDNLDGMNHLDLVVKNMRICHLVKNMPTIQNIFNMFTMIMVWNIINFVGRLILWYILKNLM